MQARRLTVDRFGYLKMVDLFHGLSEEELKACASAWPMLRFARGRVIFSPDQAEPALYIIKEGAIRLYRLWREGREVTLGLLGPGHVFGTLPLFGACSQNSIAEALSDSVLCSVREAALRDLIQRHPDVAIRLLRIIGERLAAAEDQVEDLAFRSASERVARAIVRLRERSQADELCASHEEIAKEAGVARETVTKVLHSMKRNGWIEVGYRSIKIVAPWRVAEVTA